ncbi:hypothetical protein [Anaplasma marginale]|uniref:hypothetical protein n=1 Tax=Anaplasma marginale TaxID=770 RepID=UPI0014034269|nr:hypothetical protein [Anaplasma marginale]
MMARASGAEVVPSWAEVPGVEGTRSWEMLVTVEVNRCRELWWSCQVGLGCQEF